SHRLIDRSPHPAAAAASLTVCPAARAAAATSRAPGRGRPLADFAGRSGWSGGVVGSFTASVSSVAHLLIVPPPLPAGPRRLTAPVPEAEAARPASGSPGPRTHRLPHARHWYSHAPSGTARSVSTLGDPHNGHRSILAVIGLTPTAGGR